jgi:hypothetical protein
LVDVDRREEEYERLLVELEQQAAASDHHQDIPDHVVGTELNNIAISYKKGRTVTIKECSQMRRVVS